MADGIYFESTSLIDGSPVYVILRGRKDAMKSAHGKANAKTGAMIQTYIIPRDVAPGDSAKSGADVSVCGDCPHRPALAKESGAARCYVNLAHGPRIVFDAVKRGAYRPTDLRGAVAYVRGLKLRMGAWGDPGAVDAVIWHALAASASEHTGYTHRWRDTGAALRGICMASVDSIAERDEALALLWATFRVADGREDARERVKGESQCPASAEAGKRLTCAECPIKCNGATGGRVIIDHGPGGLGRKIARDANRKAA